MNSSLTQQMARFVTTPRLLPEAALAAATNAMIDTIGCALAGIDEPVSVLARAWADHQGGKPLATIWGSAQRTSATEAALANGIAAHVHDFDDGHVSLRAHPSTTLVPAVLAYGESVGSSGAAVLSAYTLGLEVAAKLTKAIGPSHYLNGWHNTVTIGVLSCTTAVGHLCALNEEQMRMAWGLAASQSAGLRRNFGTMTKSFHAGHAARVGIESAWLAAHGMTADADIWEGEHGFLDIYGGPGGESLEDLIGQMGQPWEVITPGNYNKRWPCCGQIHRALVGVGDLIERNAIRSEEIETIRIGFAPNSDVALTHDNPQTGLEGKFSIQYSVAAYVLDGELTMVSYLDEKVHRPMVRALMGRVERYTTDDPKKDYTGLGAYTDVTIVTTRGSFARRVEASDDRPARIVTDDEHDEKFRACVVPVFGRERTESLLQVARRCATLADVRELTRATASR